MKRFIFDEFLTPLLVNETEHNSRVRFLNQELYEILRFTLVICYRLEYCLKVIEEIPPVLRQSAVYGTRAAQPIPMSQLNTTNLGTSLFGNNTQEYLEQQGLFTLNGMARPMSKQQAESIPLLVSQRVFNGHQPYGNLLNTTEPSINNCTCGSVVCPFCGGVGAGLNGTLSGNINMRLASGQAVELSADLANGIYDQDILCELTWDEMVFQRMQKDPVRQKTRLRRIQTFVEQQTEIQLIYRLNPALPSYDGEICQIDDKIVHSYAVAPYMGQASQSASSKRSKSRSRETSTVDNQTPVQTQQSII